MNDNNTLGILDIFEFRRTIDDSLIEGVTPNKYYITAQGEVSVKKCTGYNENGERIMEYIPVGSNKPGKYAKCNVHLKDGTRKTVATNKLIAQAYLPLPEGADYSELGVRFKDGNKNNLRASNMEWVTREEQLESARTHIEVNGEKAYNATLTNAQVHEICKMLQDGFDYVAILQAIGKPVTRNNTLNISKIKNGTSWKHISKDYNFPNKR